jgi:hypothetical protein
MSTPALTWDDVDVWALLWEIDQLKAQVADLTDRLAHQAAGPVAGGPPREWDRWIMQLPDGVFTQCLGPNGPIGAAASWPRAKRRTWAA